MKNLNIYLPKNLAQDLENLPKFPNYNKDIAIYYLWCIQRACMWCDWSKRKSDRYWTPLKAEYLKKISYNYKKYFNLFIKAGLIEKPRKHRAFANSRLFKFKDLYYNKEKYWFTLKNAKLIEKISKLKRELPEKTKKRLELLQQNITVENEAIDKINNSNWDSERKAAYLGAINKIKNKNFFITKSIYGREFSNLTNLPKIIRPFLKIDGEPIYEIDITAAQPTFLERWLQENRHQEKIPPEELEKYAVLIKTATFYETVQKWWLQDYSTTITRDEAKLVVFKVFFDRERPQPKKKRKTNWHYQQLFKKRFPNIYQCLHRHNFAQILQKLESNFVFSQVEQLPIPYFTIHDAVYIPYKYKDYYKDILNVYNNSIEYNGSINKIDHKEKERNNSSICCRNLVEEVVNQFLEKGEPYIETAKLYNNYKELCLVRKTNPMNFVWFGKSLPVSIVKSRIRVGGKRKCVYLPTKSRGNTMNKCS